MAKHEAVDRLMALATEKRADRIPPGAAGMRVSPESSAPDDRAAASIERAAVPGQPAGTSTGVSVLSPSAELPAPPPLDRGRKLLQAIRPLLPAVAGAMRLVDHGAVQALARLLPLLGGGSAAAATQGPAISAEQEQLLRELQAAHQSMRREFETLTLQAATTDELLGRVRNQLERLTAGQVERASEARALADRVRLVSAGLIILLMLIVAQIILVVVMMHK